MELSLASTKSGLTRFPLSSLPLECLDHILSFYIPNGCVNLILTGDKRLIAKVCRASRLFVSWTKSGFATWKAVSPLVKSFSKLESLVVTTLLPRTLTQGPVNAGFFSSKLRRLTLRYYGCSALLSAVHAPILFKPLTVLVDFTAQDDARSYNTVVTLTHFPPSLRSLRILGYNGQFISDCFVYDRFEELNNLPRDLEVLHLHALCSGNLIDFAWPPTLCRSLVDLSIRLLNDSVLDITPLAPRLTRLDSAEVEIRIGSLDPFSPDVSLKDQLPALRSLRSRLFTLSHWDGLRKLPPGLIELEVNFTPSLLSDIHCGEVLELLNLDSVDDHGVLQFAAPRHIRLFEQYEYWRFGQLSLQPHLSRHLESLAHSQQQAKIADLLTLSEFPKSLLVLELTSIFTLEMITLLPPSLEKLIIRTNRINVLQFLALHCESRAGCALKSLDMALEDFNNEFLSIDASTFSCTLEHLKISLPDTPLSISLRNHQQLATLDIAGASFVEIVPNLPSSLKTLILTLKGLVNLADPDEAMTLYHMNHFLPHLRVLDINSRLKVSVFDKVSWIRAFSAHNPPQLSWSRWIALPWSLKKLYANYYLRSNQVNTQMACDLFAYACLPRRLTSLQVAENGTTNLERYDMGRQLLLGVVKFQFPLLALPMLSWLIPHPDPLVYALPPGLSWFGYIPGINMLRITDRLLEHSAGFPQRDFDDPTPKCTRAWWTTPAYHIANAIVWLVISQFGPSSWSQNSLLRLYMMSAAVGSAITAPLVLWKIHRCGLLPPSMASTVPYAFGTVLFDALCFSTASNLLLSYSIASTGRPIFRGLALLAGAFVCLFHNLWVQRPRR